MCITRSSGLGRIWLEMFEFILRSLTFDCRLPNTIWDIVEISSETLVERLLMCFSQELHTWRLWFLRGWPACPPYSLSSRTTPDWAQKTRPETHTTGLSELNGSNKTKLHLFWVGDVTHVTHQPSLNSRNAGQRGTESHWAEETEKHT